MPRPCVLVIDAPGAEAGDGSVSGLLDGQGYAVKTAGSAAAALETARGGFDVALLEPRLPDGPGTLLVGSLKEAAPDGEVVLLTGHATLETASVAVRLGAFACLTKPCASDLLLGTIERALRLVRLRAEKRTLVRRAQVAEKLAAVGLVTASLSHEIRNPLNAAGLQLEVVERRLRRLAPTERAPLLQPVGLVRDELRRLAHLLDEFLLFARPREQPSRAVACGEVLDRALAKAAVDAGRRAISLEREGAPEPLEVCGDGERLQRAVGNLVANALEATPANGRVRVSGRASGAEVLLAVDDSGPGIPAGLHDRIFEPFFTTRRAGTGLGLPMVRAVAAQHGGEVTHEPSPLGGARFVLRLPRARTSAAGARRL